ncbi:hypothetical protein M9434_005089 [Picochlorum sp. BPE23]|nr:hypothetical protein M9434_005089 [Picochlorum sp. BPE23]
MSAPQQHRDPLLLFDIMDTIVRDPFYERMPAHFGLAFEELLEQKHPDMWVRFEHGEISEDELIDNFFKDGRVVDKDGLVHMMRDSYEYIDGIEDILCRLNASGYEIRAFSNYPVWYQYIEEKLQVSKYLQWTYVSCEGPLKGKRKPKAESFECVIKHSRRNPRDLLFVDDRDPNIVAAMDAGLQAIHFKNASQLERDLKSKGLTF